MCGLHVASAHDCVLSVEGHVAQRPRDPVDCLSDREEQLWVGQNSGLIPRSCLLPLHRGQESEAPWAAGPGALGVSVNVGGDGHSPGDKRDLVEVGRDDHSTELAGEHVYEDRKLPFLLQGGPWLWRWLQTEEGTHHLGSPAWWAIAKLLPALRWLSHWTGNSPFCWDLRESVW